MRNEYIFDYRLVLKEEPAFKKFVDCTSIKAIQEQEQDLTSGGQDNTEPQTGTYCSRYYGGVTPKTEAETDIIEFAHDRNVDIIDTHELNDEFLLDPDSRVGVELFENFEIVTLKKEYEDPPNPNFNPSILQLPPPNRFLMAGSKAWQGEDTFYQFSELSNRNATKFVSIVEKYRFSHYPPFIRLQRASYRFDRKRNIMSERKKYLSLLVYNTNTQQLYLLRKIKNSPRRASHFHTSITKVFNVLNTISWNIGVPTRIINKFISAVEQATLKDVPGLIIPEMPTTTTTKPGRIIRVKGLKNMKPSLQNLLPLSFNIE